MPANYIDICLGFDQTRRTCDLVLAPDGDLALDLTSLTPMLVSIGSDRRARPDDTLPTGISDLDSQPSLIERRGWAGDALDPEGKIIGSRLWLLDRAKQTEETRQFAELWAGESLAWAAAETGQPAAVAARWLRPGVLTLTCTVGEATITRTWQV